MGAGRGLRAGRLLAGRTCDPGQTAADNRNVVMSGPGCCAHERPGATSPAPRQPEERPPPLQPLVPRRGPGTGAQGADNRSRQSGSADRFDCAAAPAGRQRKSRARDPAPGRSRGGRTTKSPILISGEPRRPPTCREAHRKGRIEPRVEPRGPLRRHFAKARPMRSAALRAVITAGQRGDVKEADTRLDGRAGGAVLADKAFDANALRAVMGADAVIPSNRIRTVPSPTTPHLHASPPDRALFQPPQALPPPRHHATSDEPTTSTASLSSPPRRSG